MQHKSLFGSVRFTQTAPCVTKQSASKSQKLQIFKWPLCILFYLYINPIGRKFEAQTFQDVYVQVLISEIQPIKSHGSIFYIQSTGSIYCQKDNTSCKLAASSEAD